MVNNDGTGLFTAFKGVGGTFDDENAAPFRHHKGAVSMANHGADSNSCQFMINLVVRGSPLPSRAEVWHAQPS